MNAPDPRKHLLMSMVKSMVRIVACTSLIFGSYIICGILLIFAEIIGIAEELV